MQSEQRIYPRMPVDLPAELVLASGESADIRLMNLSRGGFMVEGNDQVHRLLEEHKPRFPVEVDIHFGLRQQPVRCHCRLVHAQRLCQTRYHFGLKLLGLDLKAQQLLNEMLAEYEATGL